MENGVYALSSGYTEFESNILSDLNKIYSIIDTVNISASFNIIDIKIVDKSCKYED